MRTPAPWRLLFAVTMVPWLSLMGLGGYWLWQNGYLYASLWLAVALYGLAWLGGRWLVNRSISPFPKLSVFQPDPPVSPAAEAAWAKVEKMAAALDPSEYSLGEPAKLIPLARRIIIEVAKRFNPNAAAAELDVPLPGLLLIIERVSRDMRELLTEQVPASHLISIRDGLVLWRWKENLRKLGLIGGVASMLTSPVAGMMHPARMALLRGVARYPLAELERWLLQTIARKFGYYAILLYSGELRMNGASTGERSPASARDMESALHLEEASQGEEPLRILVAGQTKAGKSSLINALFGELRAPVDAVPSTHALSPYRLELEGEFLGLVFDSPGYGEHVSWVEESRADIAMIDLVLLACSATHAGRAADSRFLEALRAQFADTPDRLPPPVIVAVTHIDLLRPVREWDPPYNIGQPSGFKEAQIRLCMEEIAARLAISPEQVQAVCLKAGGEWNVEAVWNAIAARLPQARQARYLRCLKDGRAREKWELTLRQLGNAGRLVVGGIWKGLTAK